MGNSNSGRRPQATVLKVLRGNPGQRKLNTQEPTPPAGIAVKPARLSEGAGPVWDELAPVCMVMGTLTPADVSAFVTFCELRASSDYTIRQKATTEPDKMGRLFKTERELANALRPYYEKFGLEPSGRARISLPKTPSVNKWADVIG